MSVAETVQNNVNTRTVQLVKLLTKVGPDIPLISRSLGQFKESVRYRYKEKILSKGFAIQAAVDHEKLGLRRRIILVEVADDYKNYADSIFAAMNELCYLVGFVKTLVGGEYILNFSVPESLLGETNEFFNNMKEKGLFSKMDILDFDWFRNAPMKPEYYDFDTGRWDFDWQNPATPDLEAVSFIPSTPVKFDLVDLLIIKELQIDANKSLKEIADKLQVNYKKLAWHYGSHVVIRKFLHGYFVNWTGTRYDYAIEKALHRKHRYFALDILVRDLNENEVMTLRQAIDKLPFLWAEAAGKNYFAQLFIPVDFVVEGLQFLGASTSAVKERMSLYPLDQTQAGGFTIPYSLYDVPTKKWAFNKEQLTTRFETLLVKIKEGTV